jgi:DNA polymerase-3 subunit delta
VLRGFDFTSIKSELFTALLETLALLPEYDYNTVILQVSSGLIDEGRLPKKPSTVLKKLAEVATPVRFEQVSPSRLAAWASKHFHHLGVEADGAACSFLVDYVGRDMFQLTKEIEKIAYFALEKGEKLITSGHIREVACPALDCDTFALSNAILASRPSDALDALAVLKFERVEPNFVMSELSKTLCNMQAARILLDAGKSSREIASQLSLHQYAADLTANAARKADPARLARAVALSVEADAAIKRSYADYGPIERLICSL